MLSLFYKPSPDQAFESVQAIITEVEFGWLVRSVHSWGANLIIGVLFLHVLTTFMMRAYHRPREYTWVTGILLLGTFMALGFSGYLLPWNELSFFATRVGTALVGVLPVVGEQAILAALAALFPWELGEKADPFGSAPAGIKPEWYFLFMFQALKQLPPHIMGMEGEMVGVLFFGAVGIVILLIPFLDRGPFSRRALNLAAVPAVLFFIVMTAWGYFDELYLSVILGSSLLLGMFLLVFPFLDRGTFARRELWVLVALTILLLIVSIADALLGLHIWENVANWLSG